MKTPIEFSGFDNCKKRKYFFLFLCCSMIFSLLPFILFGNNSIITIHDSLDGNIPILRMLHDNGLFFKFNAIGKGYNEMSTLYYSNYSFQSLLYCVFGDFTAYVLTHFFSVLFGFSSMYVLLSYLRLPTALLGAVSACYAILPVFPCWNIAAGTLPLIIVVFFYFARQDTGKISWKIIFMLFFPFFSSFVAIGLWVLGFWIIGMIVLGIKKRELNLNLLIGFFLLCAGYIIVDMQLFYVMFAGKEPVNRNIFEENMNVASTLSLLKVFLHKFLLYAVSGYTYHAPSMQLKVIVPVAIITSFFLLFQITGAIKKQTGNIFVRIKTIFGQLDNKIQLLFIIELLVLIFAGIAALYESGLLITFFKKYIPVLVGFNWGRVWIFNRVLWYIIFALCLYCILHTKDLVSNFGGKTKWTVKPLSFFKRIVYVIIGVQIMNVLFSPQTFYNDQSKTWFNEIFIKTGIAEKIFHKSFDDDFISYKEFFSEDFFSSIKEDISYNDEKVVAFGFHPSVLLYNGFNCIDGYLSFYPLHHMQKFRALIAPELNINEEARNYYDSWGGRMYLYNSELDYLPTQNKNISPVKLNIDTDVFRNDFNGKYILSRAEILNVGELDLNFKKKYYNETSIYSIYLYEVAD